jgi:hypothetical protein
MYHRPQLSLSFDSRATHARTLLPAALAISREKVTKSEEEGDDAEKCDAVSPRFVSAFAAAESVTNLETCRKGTSKAPRTLVCHTAAFGGINKHQGCGYIAATAAAPGEHAEKNNYLCRRQG